MKDTKSSSTGQTDNKPQTNNINKKVDNQTRAEKTTNIENLEEAEASAQTAVDASTDAEAKIAELESRVAEYLDKLLRSQAEVQNAKKRAEREIAQVRSYANERFATELLAIKDSIEMGLQADIKDNAKKLHEGLELTLRLLQQVFEKFGIKEINPEGEIFNPDFHQAMMTQADEHQPPNTVLKVLQKGYLLNDRLLRAAMVCVSSAPETLSETNTDSDEGPNPTQKGDKHIENTAESTKNKAN